MSNPQIWHHNHSREDQSLLFSHTSHTTRRSLLIKVWNPTMIEDPRASHDGWKGQKPTHPKGALNGPSTGRGTRPHLQAPKIQTRLVPGWSLWHRRHVLYAITAVSCNFPSKSWGA
ncbi:hypothetical protein CH063_11753 [Colletotrichum higginsianum]|uniref:Uncharacterized protein n=1 Tax=Colletotrichum higginsianum (strain IMI 349063) TaxID=759273 RepID=H1VMP0_COLHI|nr:hypothetical protein CH063_11753 [Colletotrichum higginsianum]